MYGGANICYYDTNGNGLGYELLWDGKNGSDSKVLTPIANAKTFRIRLYYAGDGDFSGFSVTYEKKSGSYTNQLPISTDKDGSIFNGTGYKVGYRINSSDAVVAVGTAGATNPVFTTGFIPVTTGQIIYLKDCYIDTDGINGVTNSAETKAYYGHDCNGLNIILYNATKAAMHVISWMNAPTSEYLTIAPDADGIAREFTINRSGVSYIRLVLAGDAPNAIITVDQPITD
jgi:hypothetical protein